MDFCNDEVHTRGLNFDGPGFMQTTNLQPFSINGFHHHNTTITSEQCVASSSNEIYEYSNPVEPIHTKIPAKRRRTATRARRVGANPPPPRQGHPRPRNAKPDALVRHPLAACSRNVRPATPKSIDPFDPECCIPLPFQMRGDFDLYGVKAVYKRNERERLRVQCVNDGYENLRMQLPNSEMNRRLSKVDTLRLAARYIGHLRHLLVDPHHDDSCDCDLQPQRSYTDSGNDLNSRNQSAASDVDSVHAADSSVASPLANTLTPATTTVAAQAPAMASASQALVAHFASKDIEVVSSTGSGVEWLVGDQ